MTSLQLHARRADKNTKLGAICRRLARKALKDIRRNL